MSRLVVRNYSISLDGYAAGPHQDLDNPLGIGGMRLHEWIFATRSFAEMTGREGGSQGVDDAFFSERQSGVGATIMSRKHVRSGTWTVGRQRVDRLVGRGAALSTSGLRSHSPTACPHRNARGNYLPFH
jgi:hypothetical protein